MNRRHRLPSLFCFGFSLGVLASSGCTTVREVQDPALTQDGKATRLETDDVLAYSASQTIAAPPEKVWALLTDADKIPGWLQRGDPDRGHHRRR